MPTLSYQITGLDPAPFQGVYGLSDAALAEFGVKRCIADAKPGYPDRIELRDAEPGERLLLLNFEHQPAPTAYRASHAIFVLEGATKPFGGRDIIPEALRARPISLRAFNAAHEIVTADLADGDALEPLVVRFLARSDVAYLHAHCARRGCYAALINRA